MKSKTIVLKFGGTSVGSIERIKIVSKIILSHKSKNTKIAVISSAMSGVTNELIKKTKFISNNFEMLNTIHCYQLVNRLPVH